MWVGSFEPTFSYSKGSSLNCIIFFVLTKVYGYPGLETVVWYIIFSVIKSLKIWKTAYWRTKTFRKGNSGGLFFFSLGLGKSQSTSAQEKYPKTNRGQEISTKGGDYMSIEEMKNVDVRTVDRDSLVDINEIEIDDNLPPKERAEAFLRQIKNPYCFRVGKVVVKNVYSDDGVSLQERFEQFARTL